MSRREDAPPTRKEVDGVGGEKKIEETHPAFGLIGASRVQCSPPGSSLFDSDIRHHHTVVVRLRTAKRSRHLKRDWIGGKQEFLEVEMSEAQWASFVSSMGHGDGVPCTIRRREDEVFVPGLPHEPRLEESISEVRGAAEDAFGAIQEAFKAYDEKRNAANRRALEAAIRNAPANVAFTGEALIEHAENVVQKARFDIEAIVNAEAQRRGLGPGDLPGRGQLMPPDEEEDPG